jgi:hypothetical protein
MKIKKLEIILTSIIFLGLWLGLSYNTGGPIYSDELLYSQMGLLNQRVPNYGNRYFHVYLQKLFMNVSSHPIVGIRVFWAFLIAVTALMVYWSARSFNKKSTYIHGILAIVIFFTYRMISYYSGIPSVDITAMTMATALVLGNILYYRTHKKWLLYAIGAFVFLAFKTKETTLFVNIIFLGFFFDKEGKFDFRNILPYLKELAIGFAGGIVLFIMLDTIFLGKPFFAISPTTFSEVFQNYAYTGGFRKEPLSWYEVYLLRDITMPFLLFIISGVKLSQQRLSIQEKTIWVYPLLLVSFITINMLKIPWGFIERFYFPGLPTIAILGPQFLEIKPSKAKNKKWQPLIIGLLMLMLIFVMRKIFMNYVEHIDWTYGKFLDSIYFPILFSILIGTVVLTKKNRIVETLLVIFIITSMALPKISHNYKYTYVLPETNDKFNYKFYPFLQFQDKIRRSNDVKMFISASFAENVDDTKMMSDNPYDLVAMYNVLFNLRTTRENLTIAYVVEDIPDLIVSKEFDFILISESDWDYLRHNGRDELAQLEEVYDEYHDGKNIAVFYDLKDW